MPVSVYSYCFIREGSVIFKKIVEEAADCALQATERWNR